MSAPIYSVLHLEDSDLDADFVRQRLDRAELPVVIERVSDQKNFVQQLKSRRFDVILSDYQVPTITGFSALELGRELQPETPFIFVSGQMGEELAVDALKRGATDYVLKERLARLPAAIERALAEAKERSERKAAEAARAEAEAELRRSESRFRAIVETNPECVNLVSPDGTLLQMNRAGLAMVEADAPEAALGSCVYDLIAPEDRERFREFNERICRGDTGRLEFDLIGLRGTRRHMETHAVPLQEPSGDFLQMAVTRDVTSRKRAEKLLRQTELRFRQLADTMPNLAWMARPDGYIFWYNKRWHEYTGTTPAEMEGWAWQRIHDPEILPTVMEKWRHSIESGEPFEMVFPLRSLDGEFQQFLTRVHPLRENDQILYWFGTNTNISAQIRAEKQLGRLAEREKQRADLLERLAAASRTINSVLSLESMLRVVAHEARNIIGTHASRIYFHDPDAGRAPIEEFAVSEKYSSSDLPVAPNPSDGNNRDSEIQKLPRTNLAALPQSLSDRVWLEVSLMGHAGRCLGTIRVADKQEGDFTEEDELVLEQLAAIASVGIENARLLESLQEQDKRKDEFLATLAHELRNPLAPIRNGLTLLGMCPVEESPPLVAMMDRQLTQLVRLVDDLLDVSRVTTGKIKLQLENIDLREIVAAAIEASRPLSESFRHEVQVSLPAEPLHLKADRTRLAQILTNLLNNAAKYTPPGGHIRLTAERDHDFVAIHITDTGIGIPSEMLSRVFDMFLQVGTAERTQDGLGIGLTLVQRLVQMHGGTITAESQGPNRGSTFTVRLPLQPANDMSALRGSSLAVDSGRGATTSRRILVVDDNIDGAKSLAKSLELSGHTLCVAHNGPDALTTARDFHPEVVFLDIGLPGISGYDVARQIRSDKELRDISLIALTGWGSEKDKRLATDAGFDHHLTKPVEFSVLKQLLNGI